MSRAILTLQRQRDMAHDWVNKAPEGTRVEFKGPRRSLDQNSKMWVMLTEVSRQLEWHGERLKAQDWKLLFLDALNRETRTIPSIDGKGMVKLGRSSSDLSKDEMAQLIELISAFGAQNGVKFDREDRVQQEDET